MSAPERAPRPGWGAVIGQSVQRDPVLLPAVLIALVGTGFAVIAPPAWLARVPTAVVDVATGARDQVAGERDASAAREAALSEQIEAGRAEARRRATGVAEAQGAVQHSRPICAPSSPSARPRSSK